MSPVPRRAAELLRLPVSVRGIRLGRSVDVLLEADVLRVVGLEILCGDGSIRFLPIAAARVGGGGITIDSPFLLVDHDERSFYRQRTRSLRRLRGAEAVSDGRSLGHLEDVVLSDDGAVVALVLAGGERIAASEGVRLLPRGAASAA